MRRRCLRPVNTRNAVTRWQRGRTPREPNPSWLRVPKPSLLWLRDDERRRRSSVCDDYCRSIDPRVWSGLIASRVAGGVPRWEPSGVTGFGFKTSKQNSLTALKYARHNRTCVKRFEVGVKDGGGNNSWWTGIWCMWAAAIVIPNKPQWANPVYSVTARSCRAGNTWLDK